MTTIAQTYNYNDEFKNNDDDGDKSNQRVDETNRVNEAK